MRKKLISAMLLALLLLAMTVVPAFANIDGPPPDSAGCTPSSQARRDPGRLGDPIKCFDEPDTALGRTTGH